VSGFCPDGYVPVQEAIEEAAQHWFGERLSAVEAAVKAGAPASKDEPDNSIEAAARAFSQASLPDPLRHEFEDIARQTVHRLRNVLHQGKQLKAYYFGSLLDNDRQAVSREFWATPAGDGALEAGTYWPFGRPNTWYERRPSYPLLLIRLELDALLNDEPSARKPSLPAGKMSKLVEALHELDHLNRAEQRKTVNELPEFRRYHITDDNFNEAARQAGRRKAGRKPPRR
jgi:hypothetical protein